MQTKIKLNIFKSFLKNKINIFKSFIKIKLSIFFTDLRVIQFHYKHDFTVFYYLLPILRFTSVAGIICTTHELHLAFLVCLEDLLESGSIQNEEYLTECFSRYLLNIFGCLYLLAIFIDWVITQYIIKYANQSVKEKALQATKATFNAVMVSTIGIHVFSYLPIEPTWISNKVHVYSPFGRKFDYAIGSLSTKVKGDIIAGNLGRENMLNAVKDHAVGSIVDANSLNKIISDPKYLKTLRENTSLAEKIALGISITSVEDIKEGVVKGINDSFVKQTIVKPDMKDEIVDKSLTKNRVHFVDDGKLITDGKSDKEIQDMLIKSILEDETTVGKDAVNKPDTISRRHTDPTGLKTPADKPVTVKRHKSI